MEFLVRFNTRDDHLLWLTNIRCAILEKNLPQNFPFSFSRFKFSKKLLFLLILSYTYKPPITRDEGKILVKRRNGDFNLETPPLSLSPSTKFQISTSRWRRWCFSMQRTTTTTITRNSHDKYLLFLEIIRTVANYILFHSFRERRIENV